AGAGEVRAPHPVPPGRGQAAGDRRPGRGRPGHRLPHPPPGRSADRPARDHRAARHRRAPLTDAVDALFLPLVVGCGGTLLVALAAALAGGLPSPAEAGVGGVAPVGRVLLGPLLVGFELTAPLLLVAIVGAVTIWRRQEAER